MFIVELYSEGDSEALSAFEAETLGDVALEVKTLESDSQDLVDYAKVYEGEDVSWYLVTDEYMLESADQEETDSLEEDFGDSIDDLVNESGWFADLLSEELQDIDEAYKKRVSSTGKVTRVQSKKIRSRRATRTTGMSRSSLKRRAKKAAKTRKRDVGGTKRAVKKRKKAMRKRRQIGA